MKRSFPFFNISENKTYMKVEDVLRHLRIFGRTLPIPQYKIGDEVNHFFRCSEVAARIGEREFRLMECEVVTYHVENKK